MKDCAVLSLVIMFDICILLFGLLIDYADRLYMLIRFGQHRV